MKAGIKMSLLASLLAVTTACGVQDQGETAIRHFPTPNHQPAETATLNSRCSLIAKENGGGQLIINHDFTGYSMQVLAEANSTVRLTSVSVSQDNHLVAGAVADQPNGMQCKLTFDDFYSTSPEREVIDSATGQKKILQQFYFSGRIQCRDAEFGPIDESLTCNGLRVK